MKRTLLAAAAGVLIAGGILIVLTAWARQRRSELEFSIGKAQTTGAPKTDADWLTDYRLTDQMGKPFDSHSLDKQVHVVSFFFSACPSACFKQNTKLSEICKEFIPRDVSFISITCDPDTDTPSVLNQYAKRLNAPEKGWYFLTGKMEYLQRVASEVYSVPLDKGTHVESFLVIDKWGVRRGKFAWNEADQIAEMRKLLPQLLAETSPPPPPKGIVPATPPADEDESSSNAETTDAVPPPPSDSQTSPAPTPDQPEKPE